MSLQDTVKEILHSKKRIIPGFPIAGVDFIDLLSMLAEDPSYLRKIIELLKTRVDAQKPDALAAIDSRGFIYAAPLAFALDLPLVVVRKKGKLPPPTATIDYECEYAKASLELAPHTLNGKKTIVLVDDILATGGTAKATIDLLEKHEVKVVEALFIGEIMALPGRKTLGDTPVFSCIEY
jgi:adenine phosphoribosyltransferase